jgi:aryl-alcohol dehydrogenase-like predicted oxidoreductase
MRTGTVPMAWSPLGGGRLATGDGVRPELLDVLDALAAREGVDRATIAIAFVLAHPAAPIAVVGSQTPERIAGSTAALDVELSAPTSTPSSRLPKEFPCHEHHRTSRHPRDLLVQRPVRRRLRVPRRARPRARQ